MSNLPPRVFVQPTMKTLLLILLPFLTLAQCQTPLNGSAHLTFPSFVTLLNNGRCASGNIQDTTICSRIPRRALFQRAAFSFSSPIGEPAFVTNITQYDSFCNVVEFGNIIAPGTDTVTVCYTIETELIDNFCPYALILLPLKVEWCGLTCSAEAITFTTCSNLNTDRFEVQVSEDTKSWRNAARVYPYYTTNSNESVYTVELPSMQGNYVRVLEYDLNGTVSISEVFYFERSADSGKQVPYLYDLSGRRVGNSEYIWNVKQ